MSKIFEDKNLNIFSWLVIDVLFCVTEWNGECFRADSKKLYLRDCLMRIKVGIAIYKSKALFKGYCHPSYNFNFIEGTLHSEQKRIQHMNGPTILDGLHNSRCDSFCCVRVILDVAAFCMDKHTRIS